MTDRIGVTRNSPNTSFWLEADMVSQNVAGNYSTLALYLRCANGPSGSTGSYAGGYGIQWGGIDGFGEFGQHNGNPFLPSGYAQNQLRWRDGPWYVNIPHNSDGTRGAVTLRMILNYVNTGGVDVHYTGSIGPFPTIPRASTPSWAVAGNATAGVAKTLNTNRADASFTHDITYTFGAASGSIGTGIGASVSWTPPLTLLNQMPNAAVASGTITTVTKSGSTVIGTTNVGFSLAAAADVVPDFTTVTHSEATAGVAANVGAYVQGISTLALAVTGAAGIYGSTIVSYKIEVSGQTLNAQSGTSTPLSSSGTYNIVGTITDSRGRQKSKNISITVLPYAPPVLNTISVQRALNTGVVDEDEGTYFRVNINAVAQSLINSTERNAINYRISTRVKGTSTWTVKANTAPGGITFNSFATVGTFSLTTAYETLVEVYDDFTTSAIMLTTPVAEIFMHWDGSLGVGIGKYRENGQLDIAGDIYHRNGAILEPVGVILSYAGATAPSGWLVCDGAEISRTTYAALFALIGTAYGAGNGSTTFNLPNLKGRVPVGLDSGQAEFDTLGETGGAKTHTLTIAEMPAHAHGFSGGATLLAGNGTSGTLWQNAIASGNNFRGATLTNTGSGDPHNNLQPYVTINYIIKT